MRGTPDDSASADLSGTTIARGKYRLVRLLGEGGGGQVYVGEQTALSKQVAIKLLAPEYARNDEMLHRFLREARAAARVEHENVITIFDFGSTGTGTAYIAMEYLEGEDLGNLLEREGALGWHRAKTIALQICRALHVAHGNGIIHRDLKPENCFRIRRRRNEDFIKVLDFGLAKIFGDERSPQQALSNSGKIFGSPVYMSPEQGRGLPADDRSDVYALGIILFEMLTGTVPFYSEESHVAILVMHATDPVPLPSRVAPEARITPEMDALVLKALAKDPTERFQSMKDLAEAILAVPNPDAGAEPQVGALVHKGGSTGWLDQPNAQLVVALAGICLMLTAALVIALLT
jgi:serine/threonine protein kinase